MLGIKEVNNLGFDMDKTKELIEDLRVDGTKVGVEDLSQYIRTQGVIVKVHIGRVRNYIETTPKYIKIIAKIMEWE